MEVVEAQEILPEGPPEAVWTLPWPLLAVADDAAWRLTLAWAAWAACPGICLVAVAEALKAASFSLVAEAHQGRQSRWSPLGYYCQTELLPCMPVSAATSVLAMGSSVSKKFWTVECLSLVLWCRAYAPSVSPHECLGASAASRAQASRTCTPPRLAARKESAAWRVSSSCLLCCSCVAGSCSSCLSADPASLAFPCLLAFSSSASRLLCCSCLAGSSCLSGSNCGYRQSSWRQNVTASLPCWFDPDIRLLQVSCRCL
jgi:hypothetical protein